MRRTWKKAFALFLSLVMCLSLFPASAFAEGDVAEEPAVEDVAPDVPQEDVDVSAGDDVPENDSAIPGDSEGSLPIDPAAEASDLPAEEPTGEEPVEIIISGDGEEPADQPAEPTGEEEDDAAEEPVRVVFVCEPEDLTLTVYVLDEEENKQIFEPEEDGSYLLLPGEYYYDAECEGYETVKDVFFVVLYNSGIVEIPLALGLYGSEPQNVKRVANLSASNNNYVINGVSVSHTSVTTGQTNCWEYAREMYRLIWGNITDYNNDRTVATNSLRNITSEDDLRLTAEHLKQYVSHAALGAVIRTTDKSHLFQKSDSVGHSQIIVQKDANGFTVFESNINLGNNNVGSREMYYTWSQYITKWYNSNHEYIKYIKWPGTHDYTSGSNLSIIGILDGELHDNLENYGTFDVIVNGSLVANDVNSFNRYLSTGASYEITDIKNVDIHSYHGLNSGSLKGTVASGGTTVSLIFRTNDTIGDKFYAYLTSRDGKWQLYNNSGNANVFGQPNNVEAGAPATNLRNVWYFEKVDANNHYKILSAYDGRSLDVRDASGSDGANLQVYTYNGNSAQLWSIHEENGYIELGAQCTYCVIDAGGESGQGRTVNNAYMHDECENDYQWFKVKTVAASDLPKPPSVSVSTDKAYYTLGETVNISWSGAVNVKKYAYQIEKDGESSPVASGVADTAAVSWKPTQMGKYTVVVAYVNNNNTTSDFSRCSFEVGNTYTVAYNANGGTGGPGSQIKTYGTDLTLSSTKPTRANSSAGSYTVTLNANGGSVSPTSLSAARTTSYSFKNWNTAQNGSGTAYNPGAKYTANADVTLYAQWNSSTTTAAVTLPTPTRSGYSFRGWATSTSAASGTTGSYTPTGNVTLYATWKANEYTITFNDNGGTGGPGSQIKTYGTDLTLSSTKPTHANSSAGSYTVTLNANGGSVSPNSLSAARTTSYSFKNWNTAQNGSGTSYNPGTVYSMDEPLNLYAQWNSSTTTSPVTLPTPTRSGYSFQGWATNSNAANGVTGSYTPTGNVTLYAIWKADVVSSGTLKVESLSARPGEEITVGVTLSENPGISAISFKIGYDSQKLKLTGFENGELTGWLVSVGGQDKALWMANTNSTATGAILKLRFQVLETAPEGETQITLTELESTNENEEDLFFAVENGTITVRTKLSGDVNIDGIVNLKDLTRLSRNLAGFAAEINEVNADCNGDGKVNLKDLTRLSRYLAGFDVVLE